VNALQTYNPGDRDALHLALLKGLGHGIQRTAASHKYYVGIVKSVSTVKAHSLLSSCKATVTPTSTAQWCSKKTSVRRNFTDPLPRTHAHMGIARILTSTRSSVANTHSTHLPALNQPIWLSLKVWFTGNS